MLLNSTLPLYCFSLNAGRYVRCLNIIWCLNGHSHTMETSIWTERRLSITLVWLVVLQTNRNLNKPALPTHTDREILVWKREDEVMRCWTHRWLQPSGPGAAQLQLGAGARGRFPWQPRVLQLPCHRRKKRANVNTWWVVL